MAATWFKQVKAIGLGRHAVVFAVDAPTACYLRAAAADGDKIYSLASQLPPSASSNMSFVIRVRFRLLEALSRRLTFDALYCDSDTFYTRVVSGAVEEEVP